MAELTNFAYTTISAITSVDTTCTLTTGDGALFPASAFRAVIYDDYYGSPAVASKNNAAEIVLVNTRVTDSITSMTRAQEGTTARDFNTSGRVYKMILAPLASHLLPIQTGFTSHQLNTDGTTASWGARPTGSILWMPGFSGIGQNLNTYNTDFSIFCVPFKVDFPFTFTKMSFRLKSGITSGDRFDFAIFDNLFAAQVIRSGWLSASGTAAQTLTATVASTTLAAQTYGCAFSIDRFSSGAPFCEQWYTDGALQLVIGTAGLKAGFASETAHTTTGIPAALTSITANATYQGFPIVLLHN